MRGPFSLCGSGARSVVLEIVPNRRGIPCRADRRERRGRDGIAPRCSGRGSTVGLKNRARCPAWPLPRSGGYYGPPPGDFGNTEIVNNNIIGGEGVPGPRDARVVAGVNAAKAGTSASATTNTPPAPLSLRGVQ